MKHHRICTNSRMWTNRDRPKQFGACTDIDVPTETWHALAIGTDRDLLEYQAVRTDDYLGMDHDPVWMRDKQPPAKFCIQRDIGTRNCRPKAMPKNSDCAQR